MKRRLIIGLLILAALAIAGIVGIDCPEHDQATYCQNVREGIWPDYEGTYKASCGGEDPPEFHENLAK